jgi:hypothetical protein
MSTDLEHDIASVVAQLEAPLDANEAKVGWTKSMKAGYIDVFTKLLSQVQDGEAVPYFGIARSLDGYGLGDGELCERMFHIANKINLNSSI